jgi:hypothetical protein
VGGGAGFMRMARTWTPCTCTGEARAWCVQGRCSLKLSLHSCCGKAPRRSLDHIILRSYIICSIVCVWRKGSVIIYVADNLPSIEKHRRVSKTCRLRAYAPAPVRHTCHSRIDLLFRGPVCDPRSVDR